MGKTFLFHFIGVFGKKFADLIPEKLDNPIYPNPKTQFL